LCLHNSKVRSWAGLPGDNFVIIGGYESGCDAAVNLARAGKRCKVLASVSCWSSKTVDPSSELAPYTAGRLREVLAPGFSPRPRLLAPLRVIKVERSKAIIGGFDVTAEWKDQEEVPHAPLRDLVRGAPTEPRGTKGDTIVLHTNHPPILCTGFEGSVAASAGHLFDFNNAGKDEDDDDDDDHKMDGDDDHHHHHHGDHHHHHHHAKKGGCLDGAPLLTENDESTKVPGVFLVGPTVSHGKHSFCFVYKFRQRFAIVANAICKGLGVDTRAAVKECREANMYLDDLSCCENSCGDVC
jgi:hypothetical protein